MGRFIFYNIKLSLLSQLEIVKWKCENDRDDSKKMRKVKMINIYSITIDLIVHSLSRLLKVGMFCISLSDCGSRLYAVVLL